MAVDGTALITARVGVVFKLVVDGVGGDVLVINVVVSMEAGVKEVVVGDIDGCVLFVVKLVGVDAEVCVVVDVDGAALVNLSIVVVFEFAGDDASGRVLAINVGVSVVAGVEIESCDCI